MCYEGWGWGRSGKENRISEWEEVVKSVRFSDVRQNGGMHEAKMRCCEVWLET